ncbi:ABC transporter permease [Nocardia bovistercoris]|uniref:Transport permease protein n=1 Tax=Nocardia bovistercoris TaxID=2785916 RepID=A0A931N0U8_9NOCA|nr:ABC transporter permease [Nocardia bovistercoris]MBH0775339.1 ABC transporter permease [Nocardia bovistercoris]
MGARAAEVVVIAPRVVGPTETWRHATTQTAVQTRRLLVRWWRDPFTVVQSLLFPALLLVVLNTVLGKQISAAAGSNALYGSVPMVVLVGVMSGSLAGAVTLGRERDAGLLARFWVLPVHRASGLAARVVAEGIRILLCTTVLLGVGTVLGFRFERGVSAAAALWGVPLMYGLGFATLVTAVATLGAKAALVEAISLASSLLMFFSTGFAPTHAYPGWARPIVEHQPMSHAIDAMRGLAAGGPVREPLGATAIWSLGALLVFAIPAAVGYRRASRR